MRGGELADQSEVERFFGMTEKQVNSIFHRGEIDFYPNGEVTPAMVADALETVR